MNVHHLLMNGRWETVKRFLSLNHCQCQHRQDVQSVDHGCTKQKSHTGASCAKLSNFSGNARRVMGMDALTLMDINWTLAKCVKGQVLKSQCAATVARKWGSILKTGNLDALISRAVT